MLTLLYIGHLVRPGDGYSFWFDAVLSNVVYSACALVCLLRAALVPGRRAPFVVLGLAIACYATGNTLYYTNAQFDTAIPFGVSDVGYLAGYPFLFGTVIVLAWPEMKHLTAGVYLDGLVNASAFAVVGSALAVQPILRATVGDLGARWVNACYMAGDLTLLSLIVAVITIKGGRPGLTWILIAAGESSIGLADQIYLHRLATGSYVPGTPLDGIWMIGYLLLTAAAVLPYRPGGHLADGSSKLLVPNLFTVIAVGVLVYGSLRSHPLPVYVVVLTTLTLAAAVQRTAVGFSSLRLLATTQAQARTDELTQLPNRRHFDEHVQQALSGRRPGERLALVMVDLDGFKAINDTLGHHAGDELLQQIGPRLRKGLRGDDLLARLGGDEFGILMGDVDAAEATVVADRLVAELSRPFLVDGVLQTASASIGIALCPEHGEDLSVLLQRADIAMFDAKAGSGQIAVYSPDRHGAGAERLNVREALARQELHVEYQPQFDRQGAVAGAEALIRWRHPERGLIPPPRFLPFFEQAGLMAELTLFVLDVGARDARRWRLDGADLRLSVNMAPSVLLYDDLIGSIATILTRHGIPARALTLEITESVPVAESERSLRTLHDLRDLGVQLSLDDYGTGWCSLSYLRDLPLDEVKIDRSFVMDLQPGTPDAAIVESTVRLAAALGLRTVAEGVETITALSTLREMGCDYFQGYLLGKPAEAGRLARVPRAPLPRGGEHERLSAVWNR